MLKTVFLVLLAVSGVAHLYGSWVKKEKLRAVTKPMLLLFIILYYITSGVRINPLLIAALAASWLGDVLLIPKGNAWFTAGGTAFMLAHFLFIAVYVPQVDFSKVNWFVAVPAAVAYYSVSAVIIHLLRPTTPKKMQIPMYVYLLANSTMNVFALMQLISNPCAGSVVAYTGAVLFFVSDCTLFLVRYYKKPEIVFKQHFTVMLTYIVGEFLITQGIIMLSK
ncbi:MAG: lysoplasmalogenase [Clostridia bacterium]|nr:lysoplasmalogenase [Clostridia bacterium]